MKIEDAICLFVVFFFMLFMAFIAGLMFEYNLYSLTGKDAPFVLDIVIGCILNGFNVIFWLLCLLLRSIGYEAPFLD